jgi:non-specific serine/threonine protein kinase
LAERLNPGAPLYNEISLRQLETEHDNCRAALTYLLEQKQAERALRLAAGLEWFWFIHKHLTEGRRWLEEALMLDHNVEAAVLGEAIRAAGQLAMIQGDYEHAVAQLEESLTLLRSVGATRSVAMALYDLGSAACNQGDHTRALPFHEEGLRLLEDLGDQWGIATGLLFLANDRHGDYERAVELYEEALVLFRELGDLHFIVIALSDLGLTALEHNDPDRAVELKQEAVGLLRTTQDKLYLAFNLQELGMAEAMRGRPERAARLIGSGDALAAVLGVSTYPSVQALYDQWVSAVRVELGDAAWNRAQEEGRAMTLEQAIAYALEESER